MGLTLNDGQSCKGGNYYDVSISHTFDPNKKITRVELWINNIENWVLQTNFFFGEEKLNTLGLTDEQVKKYDLPGKIVERFDIADDERLIGCELDHGRGPNFKYLCGITWIKMKVIVWCFELPIFHLTFN